VGLFTLLCFASDCNSITFPVHFPAFGLAGFAPIGRQRLADGTALKLRESEARRYFIHTRIPCAQPFMNLRFLP
jgi:hypothetical protein